MGVGSNLQLIKNNGLRVVEIYLPLHGSRCSYFYYAWFSAFMRLGAVQVICPRLISSMYPRSSSLPNLDSAEVAKCGGSSSQVSFMCLR